MSGCAVTGCGSDRIERRGLCPRHYRRRVGYGVYALVDPGPTLTHLATLRGLGWTWVQIGEAAGTSSATAHSLWVGRYRRLRRDTAERLLAVPACPARSQRGMVPVGAVRRLQALQWMGWPRSEIAARVGRPTASLYTQTYRQRMSVALVADIIRVYDGLSHVRGPSKCSATKARLAGYAPPAAWDEDAIDCPAARPSGVLKAGAA